MENWQLTLVILASVLVGLLIPLLVMMTTAFHRAGREIGEVGAQLKRTLAQFEVISGRVETLSRGFQGGETSIAELLTSVGHLARGLERNLSTVKMVSTIVASVGTALSALVSTRLAAKEADKPLTPDGVAVPESRAPPSVSATSSETDTPSSPN